MQHISLIFTGLAFVGATALGCAARGSTGGGDFSGTDGGVDSSSTRDASIAGPLGDGDSCNLGCSADLHDVIDCHGNVTHCPPDQGCGASGCVAACDAAIANQTTVGCEYYAVDPDSISTVTGSCFAAFVANTWNSPVSLTVDFGGMPLTGPYVYTPHGSGMSLTYQPLVGLLPPGQVAILFLNDDVAGTGSYGFGCPAGVQAGLTTADGAVHGTGIGKAFHLVSDRPIVAYDIYSFGGGVHGLPSPTRLDTGVPSATLLVPTSAWDTNYVGVNAYPASALGQPFLQVVASQANTTVTLSPTADIVGGTGVASTPRGVPHGYVLAKPGDYLQLTQTAELTGTPILADKPVGVWGGSSQMNIDVGDNSWNTAHQQLFPVKMLGREYAAIGYRDRYAGLPEARPWRLVGAVDGTTLTYEPQAPTGAPPSLSAGQLATFWTSEPFVVKSQDAQHPFYMSAHMTGCTRVDPNATGPNGSDCRGDPQFVNTIPPAEWPLDYVFFTDPTYPETNLVVVRAADANGQFADVSLDCAGPLAGWQALGTSGKYQATRTDLSTGAFQPVGNCSTGQHEMQSKQPFGLTVWGWGSAATGDFNSPYWSEYVSYAYPAGARVQPANTVVVPPLPK